MTEKKASSKSIKRHAEESEAPPNKKAKLLKTDHNKRHNSGQKWENKKSKVLNQDQNQPVNWTQFKKQKKELRQKRRENRNVMDIRDVLPKVKQLDEKIRQKVLKGGKEQRAQLINEIHSLLSKRNVYSKLVLTHDMARIVQHILKYGSAEVREEVSNQIIPVTIDMIQSKYGKFCVKRMLKYGTPQVRSAVIKQFYGHVTKLTSHAVSAAIFEYAYSTFASQQQKHYLIQEFFGDIYKSSKDDSVKHLRDVYEQSPDMKTAALRATKANISRVLNKNFVDSGLVQSVLYQFLGECSKEDKAELISQLAPHVVILSNSRDGSKVAMQCIWNGTIKEKKTMMKALKEHIIDLAKHEYGHCPIIALFDTVDDMVILNKTILSQLLEHALELASDEWGRKVILWLVSPADKAHFHPVFLKELEEGRKMAIMKKSSDLRRSEILGHCVASLLKSIVGDVKAWLTNGSIALVTLAILKAGSGEELKEAFTKISELIVAEDWKVKDGESEIAGIEHSGLHMMLKKLAQNDDVAKDNSKVTFGECLCSVITDETVGWP